MAPARAKTIIHTMGNIFLFLPLQVCEKQDRRQKQAAGIEQRHNTSCPTWRQAQINQKQ